jgi:hypothetical protein
MRSRSTLLGLLAFCAMLGHGGQRAAAVRQAVRSEELADRARKVLTAYCSECHGEGPNPRAGLRIHDFDLVRKRGLIPSRADDDSELFDLIRTGSMPPGNHRKVPAEEVEHIRKWIEAGAPAPSPPGERYVLTHILAHWKELREDHKGRTRYLSLNHLLGSPRTAAQIEPLRKELDRLRARAIDSQQSVFCIDLRELGWDRQPFEEMDPDWPANVKRKSSVTLYDLLLLEYPYALVLDAPPSSFRSVVKVLAPRGNPSVLWATRFRDGVVDLETAEAELGWQGDRAKLLQALRELGLDALAENKPLRRVDWEKHFPHLIERLGLGTPILPLDGLTVPKRLPGYARLTVEVIDFKTKKPTKPAFRSGDHIAFQVETGRDVILELVYKSNDGTQVPLAFGERPAGRTEPISNNGKGWKLDEQETGTDEIVAFAFPQRSLASGEKSYPRGIRLRAINKYKGVLDRFLHPLHLFSADGKGFQEPATEWMIKVTASFEIRPKPK